MTKRKHIDEKEQQPAQPSSTEQSGSAGRRVAGKSDPGKDTGQGRYGQSGFGGKVSRDTLGQEQFKRSGPDGGQDPEPDSNHGSGRADRESQDYRKPPDKAPDKR